MSDDQARSMDEAVRTAFWASDLFADGFAELLAIASTLKERGALMSEADVAVAAAMIITKTEGASFALGMLQAALTTIRLGLPEASRDE